MVGLLAGPLLIVAIGWLVCGLLAGWLAEQRGRSGGAWFLVGLLLGPLAILAVGLAPVETAVTPQEFVQVRATGWDPDGARICPHCGKRVAPDRKLRCNNCGEELTTYVPKPLPPETKVCPRCAETVKFNAQVCRFCGYEFASTASGSDEPSTGAPLG